jgi:c-di-GMP-binding flagellar brake protein YcgR
MTEDRRRFARLACAIEADYSVVKKGQTVPSSTDTRNVSLGGLSFMSFDRLVPGDTLKMKLTVPGLSQPLAVRARVIWCSPTKLGGIETDEVFDTGIEFTEISEEDRERLNQFISSSSLPERQ